MDDLSYSAFYGIPSSHAGQPTWEAAMEFPLQGRWTEEDFFKLDLARGYELVHGRLELLPMSTLFHQNLVRFLFGQLETFVLARSLGRVVFAPFIVRLGPEHLRQPDVCFVRSERIQDLHTPPRGADLIMEIVSPGKENRKRDLEEKRAAYAEAGIPEYWIVDPEQKTISVLTLEGAEYRVAGAYGDGEQAASVLLPGFTVDVSAAWAAAER